MIINTGARTDTVQYYTPWLLKRFEEGYVLSRNPLFPNKVTRYELTPKTVDCVEFCSKNYKPILKELHKITDRFYTHFQYTITAYGKDVEPGVPSIDESIETLLELEKIVGAKRICWRYDPVLLTKRYTIAVHMEKFEYLASRLAGHVDRCIFSFVEMYKKLRTNMPELIPLAETDKDILAKGMGGIAGKYGIYLQTCGTNGDYTCYGIHPSGCMTLQMLGDANGIVFRARKHKGTREGCHCIESRDIGAYDTCLNGCRYCYASFMKRFTNHPEPWGKFLDVKYWPEIKNPERYAGKELFFGSVTDPYNPQEEIYCRTRALLEQFKGSGVRLSIQTKSDLVLRDVDLICRFPDARVGFSINTLDESFRADMDKAASIERRLSAMGKLHEAGIPTTCFISPIFPGITDVKAIIDRVKEQCSLIWLENLNLRGGYKKEILEYIRERHSELAPLYEEIYVHGSRQYWEALDTEVRAYAEKNGMEYVRNDDSMKRSFDAPPVIVNYFYHEEVKKSAKRERGLHCMS